MSKILLSHIMNPDVLFVQGSDGMNQRGRRLLWGFLFDESGIDGMLMKLLDAQEMKDLVWKSTLLLEDTL